MLLRQEAKRFQWNQARLKRRNESCSDEVVSASGPVVSLTTFGTRYQTVYLTLESIGRGNLKPSRLILWLDDRELFEKRPSEIQRLEARGLEVLLTANYGPHTKYYPYLLSKPSFDLPLVTADDDVIYSKWWLEGLMLAFTENAAVLNCYRAHRMKLEAGKLAPYNSWTGCKSTEASFLNFATGVSGCIYPSELLDSLKGAGDVFWKICPKADDVWLNAIALRGGFKVRQIRGVPLRFPLVAGTQETGLWNSNVIQSQNDSQIQATYTAQDLAVLNKQ